MERKYGNELLEGIKKHQYETDFQGIKVLVKPIPEGGEPGDMDPRLYRSMRMLPLMGLLMKFRKKPKTTLEIVLPLRRMFNTYKGTYIADEGVRTAHETVLSADGHPVPVRVYTPEGGGERLPVLVYFHGGGFFGGGPDIVEQMCKLLVQKRPSVVINVDYRLCPEHHYPQPLDDCWAATCWAYENADHFGGDPACLAVAGDSAGGNLAAAVTLRDREEGAGMVKAQLLLYPAVNLAGKKTEFYYGIDPSKYQFSRRHEKILRASMGLMSEMLTGGGDMSSMLEQVYLQGHLPADHIYASPLLADPAGLPPTLLLFGEHDFLVFEDFAYAQTLQKAGVPLHMVVYRGMGHGFADQVGVAPQAEDCIEEMAKFLNTVLRDEMKTATK